MSISECPLSTKKNVTSESSHEGTCITNENHVSITDDPKLQDLHSKNRVYSTIPRTGSEEVWKYPSPSMFYSAVKRKGYFEATEVFDRHPSDLESIVHIHNVVNEATWQEILKYEKLTPCSCEKSCEPSLERFVGKAKDLTVKARINHYLLGYQLPFDRHDWYISKCQRDPTLSTRYIIDFYSGSNKSNPSIHLDVRPEPSILGLLHRLKMQYNIFMDFITTNKQN